MPPSDQAKYLVSSNGFSQHSDAEKTTKEEASWKEPAKRVAILAAILIAAIVIVGGLITGFVFTCIYCPLAAEIIAFIAIVLIFRIIGELIFRK